MKAKLETAFVANHARLFRLYYVEGKITEEQHRLLHTRNWLLFEETLLNQELIKDLPVDPEDPKGEKCSELNTKLLAEVPVSDKDWKAIKLLDGTIFSGLKTVAEILKEAGL